MSPREREEFFRRLSEANPEPTTELKYRTRFELLVAVVLSAQSTDVAVNQCTKALFKVARTPKRLLELGEEGLKPYIKTLGLYNSKARNLIKTAQALVERHNSRVPADRASLEALPGVGRKTANVVLNTAFGQETIAVDTHIFRVCNRTGLAPGKNVRQVEDKLNDIVPDPYRRHAHHWLILHGRYTCRARRPLCSQCIVADLCQYERTHSSS